MQDFGTKTNDTAGPSGQLSAEEFNNLATELENAILKAGIGLSGVSVTQLATSLFLHGVKSQTFQDSGVSNAYVATPASGSSGVMLPTDYSAMNGSVILFSASNANSGASTLNFGQTTGTLIGAKNIVDQSGSPLESGAIAAGSYIQLRYDSSIGAGSWVLLPSSRPIASSAQAQGLAHNFSLLTPFGLNEAFKGSNQSFGASSLFQKMPGGLFLQAGSSAPGTSAVQNFPIAFPNNCVSLGFAATATTTPFFISFNTTSFTYTAPNSFRWIAIGF